MSDFSLREDRRPQPTQDLKLRSLPGIGTVPFRPGDYLVESETKDLVPLGWHPGDPIPPGFAHELEKVKKEVADDLATGKLKGPDGRMLAVPELRMPQELRIDQLPRERQEELTRQLQSYKELAPSLAKIRQEQVAFNDLDPGVQKAILAASQRDGVEVVDSRKFAPGGYVDPAAGIEILKAKAEAAIKPKEDPPQDTTARAEPEEVPNQCPHCLFDLNRKQTEPDKTDLAGFVVSVLGQQRFVKEYVFLGGRLRGVFRAPSTRDGFLVGEQISRDMRDGKISNIDDMFRLGFSYRLILSLDMLYTSGTSMAIGRAVDDVLENPPGAVAERGDATPLPYLVDRLREKSPLNIETVWNFLTDTTRRFHELLKLVQDRADKEGFWNTIEG
jgi:hypothetical protein